MNINTKKCAVIIASRPLSAGMLQYLPQEAFVIGADAGWKSAVDAGLTVDLAVGDFDSYKPPKAELANGRVRELLRLPAEKDDTDTHYAAKELVKRGFEQALLLGGLGGRPDHTHANLQTLLYLAESGIRAMAADEGVEIHCMGPGSLQLAKDSGRWLSVFAAGGPACGVTLEGVKYPLNKALLTPNTPLGTSNEFAARVATINCDEGYLYVMVCQ